MLKAPTAETVFAKTSEIIDKVCVPSYGFPAAKNSIRGGCVPTIRGGCELKMFDPHVVPEPEFLRLLVIFAGKLHVSLSFGSVRKQLKKHRSILSN